MSEETTLTPAAADSTAASNTGGEPTTSSKAALDPVSAIISDKEGDLRPKKGRRRKVSYLTINKIENVDYKEVSILKKFVNERGKILSTRSSGNTAKQQRMVARAIRRAREMALMPFVSTEAGPDRPFIRRERGDRGDRGPRRDQEQQVEKTEE